MAKIGLIGVVLRFDSVEAARARLVLAMSLQKALAESALAIEAADTPMHEVLAEQLVAEIARLRWVTAQFEALLSAPTEADYHEFDELVRRLSRGGQ